MLGGLAVVAKTWRIVDVLAHLPPRWLVSPSANPAIDIASAALKYVCVGWGELAGSER